MRRFLRLLLPVLLPIFLCPSSFALSRADRAAVDSLWNVAVEFSRHGRFEESNSVFEAITERYRLPRRARSAVCGWMGRNARLAGDYKGYYDCLVMKDGAKKAAGSYSTFRTLSLLPAESLSRPDGNVTIAYMIDSLYYEGEFKGCEIRIPVTVGGEEKMFILDNGCAMFSAASESFAQAHGIRPVGAEGEAVGAVDRVSMWIGLADSLSVGPMVFRNILFTVIPDKFLDNPVTKIDAILGGNIFRLAGEMDFDNVHRTVTFPFVQQAVEPNLTIDEDGEHLAEVVVNGDTLAFQLDLGAARTGLGANYFMKYRDEIVNTATADTLQFGGVGGITEDQLVYRLPEVTFDCCGASFTMHDAAVSLDRQPNEKEEFGVLGCDFILSYPSVVLNLRKMYLLF